MSNSNEKKPRIVRIIDGADSSENDGHGLHAPPDAGIDTLIIQNSTFRGNKGSGINFAPRSIAEELGIPLNTDPKELAELLVKLQHAPIERRQSIIEESSLFQSWKTRGLDALGYATNIAALCDSSTVVQLAQPLIKAFLG